MKFLFLLWTLVGKAFEATVWATLIWTAAEPFFPIEWVTLFWIVFGLLVVFGLGVFGTDSAMARAMLVIEPLLVGLAILQAATSGLVLAVIAIVVASLLHTQTDWLHVFLFFTCACYILWRRSGKKKAMQAWKGEPKPEWKPSDYFREPTPISHLPEWQRKELEAHREQRVLKGVEPGRGYWSRGSDGSLVTEVELYWATVSPRKDGKIGFTAYSKKSGQIAQLSTDYDSEKQATDAAVAWMLRGESPDSLASGDAAVQAKPESEEELENARLRTERELVEAIVLGASKSRKEFEGFIPERERKADLVVKIFLEYLCFFLHVTNRLASNVASYQEVERMYDTIAPLVVEYVLHEVFRAIPEEARRELSKVIPELIRAREIQYAKSKEYASEEGKPSNGTSTVDMLVRNIREKLDTYNPGVLFQTQLAARESMHEAKIPELIANYRRAHPSAG